MKGSAGMLSYPRCADIAVERSYFLTLLSNSGGLHRRNHANVVMDDSWGRTSLIFRGIIEITVTRLAAGGSKNVEYAENEQICRSAQAGANVTRCRLSKPSQKRDLWQ